MAEEKIRDKDLLSVQRARTLIQRANKAYQAFKDFSQEDVDKIIASMVEAGRDAARRLAELAVKETDYGNVEDKVVKNIFSIDNVYDSIKDLKTAGVINRDLEKKIIEIAHPMGVVVALTPTTNPTSTVIFKALISVKSRNAVIFSPHPNAVQCSFEAAAVLSNAAVAAGAPEGLISCLDVITLEGTRELMASRDTSIILATGGLAMVKAAHSYGKPAIGVGPGNTPAFVDKSADLEKAAKDIVASKAFDYGVICASEQAIVVEKSVDERFRDIFKANGAHFLNEQEITKMGSILIKNKGMNPVMVGKSPKYLADKAGINIPEGTKLLVAPLKGVGPDYPISREILSPIVAYYTGDSWEGCCKICLQVIEFGGVGHTLVIHSRDEEAITAFAHQKPVFRILINTPASQGAVGLSTSLLPSMTLSTGTWGGGISSDNISAKHLLNIKRVAYETNPVNPPADKDGRSAGMVKSNNTTSEKDIEGIVRKVVDEIYK